MKIHIFILTYHNAQRTLKCQESIRTDADELGATIYIIDNGSNDFGGKNVIRLQKNRPIIEAFNIAMQKYPADIYICVGNDHAFAPGTLPKLVAALSDPTVGIVSPGTSDTSAGVLYVPGPDVFGNMTTNHVDNSVWGWRHDLVDAIGYPDCEGHPHNKGWAVNADYCYRARRAGYKVMAVRSAYVQKGHNGGNDPVAWLAGRGWLVAKYGVDKAGEVWA